MYLSPLLRFGRSKAHINMIHLSDVKDLDNKKYHEAAWRGFSELLEQLHSI